MGMDAILTTIVDGERAIVDIYRGRNKLITCLFNDIILNPSTAALANPSNWLPLCWIERIY